MATLGRVFTMDICAYAIMSNHYHLVIQLKPRIVLTPQQVVDRWRQLFSLPDLVQRWVQGETLSSAERQGVDRCITQWRQRLGDLSWFMRCLNEHIARKANAEDRCRGRFWEGRFHSQALLDEKALLACMAYVDLNPIRAGMVNTPETSDYTSIQARISSKRALGLAAFLSKNNQHHDPIPFTFPDYLALVDWTGRAVYKSGSIPPTLPPILDRLHIPQTAWQQALMGYSDRFGPAIGPIDKLKQRCQRLRQHWLCGLGGITLLYAAPTPT